jgi:hypothetical protein
VPAPSEIESADNPVILIPNCPNLLSCIGDSF